MEDLISKLAEMGILTSAEALSILSQQDEPMEIVREVLEGRGELLFLEEEHILQVLALRTHSPVNDLDSIDHDVADITILHDHQDIGSEATQTPQNVVETEKPCEENVLPKIIPNDLSLISTITTFDKTNRYLTNNTKKIADVIAEDEVGDEQPKELTNESSTDFEDESKESGTQDHKPPASAGFSDEKPINLNTNKKNKMIFEEQNVVVSDTINSKKSNHTARPDDIPTILPQPPNKARGSLPTYRPIAAEYDDDIEILGDISGKSECQGNIKDFSRYFDDRFNRLKQLIKTRPKMMHALPIEKILGKSGEISTIGIVTNVNPLEKGTIIEIEDDNDSITIFIRKDDRILKDIGTIVNDEIIGVIGKVNRGRNNRGPSIYPKKIIRPPLPIHHNPSFADVELSVAFVSDLHNGSNTFLKKEWKRAIDFLNGKHHELREEASRIKYLVFPGDIVDGIGIYPDQDKDLEITDIYRQYEAVADDLNALPEHIKVILLPGNHDAVRKAEPQPALPDEIKKIFDEKRVMFTGNPIWLRLHGVNFLTYHGGSMDDLIPAIPGLSYNNPIAAMKEMMIRRHLAPIYGGKTPLAPEKLDYMLMDEIPDVFVTGHVHTTEIARFHNILLLNASTWMDQTAYQKMRDFVPDPAKLPVIRLDTLKPALINFRYKTE